MRERLVNVLAPDVVDLGAVGLEPLAVEGLGLELVADVNREWRHEVLTEVLVLVVAPYEHKVRGEVINFLAQMP